MIEKGKSFSYVELETFRGLAMKIKDTLFSEYVQPFLNARDRKSLYRIAHECFRYKKFYNIRPKDYFFLGLYMKYVENDVTQYIPNGFPYSFNIAMNGELRPIEVEDKSMTSAILRSHDVPCVSEFLSFDPAGGFIGSDGSGLNVADACAAIAQMGGRAFAKPLAANRGRGARIVSADEGEMRQIVQDDQHMIFQPVLEQHEVLAALNPSSVNTIRINTLRTDDQVESHVAALRVGRRGSIVDNAAAGGLCVNIDIETGRLGQFARTTPAVSTSRFAKHPDTGVAFESITVPHWPDVLDLAKRAARAMAPLRSLGWDIAVTSKGPIIIEANSAWSPRVFQLCQPLGPTALGAQIMAFHAARNRARTSGDPGPALAAHAP